MKVGDKVWRFSGVLHEEYVSDLKDGHARLGLGITWYPVALLFTTPEAALKECVECRDYWDRQIVKLNDLLSGAHEALTVGKSEQIRETEH